VGIKGRENSGGKVRVEKKICIGVIIHDEGFQGKSGSVKPVGGRVEKSTPQFRKGFFFTALRGQRV